MLKSATSPAHKLLAVAALASIALLQPLGLAVETRTAMPATFLWAWQRNEDLSFIDPSEFGIAYQACRVLLSGDEVRTGWRDQRLKVPADVVMVPVVRVDIDRLTAPTLSDKQLDQLERVVRKAASIPHSAAVQIDFDARTTEREFYRKLLNKLRQDIPKSTPISITALASWCLFDKWIEDLPVDETVPMMFSLARERPKILLYFRQRRDFMVTGCCKSLGISLEDEEVNKLMIPLAKQRKIPVRIYVFTKTAWTSKKIQAVRSLLKDS